MDLSNGILIASSNRGKVQEIETLLSDIKNIKIVSLFDLYKQSINVKEDGESFQENALIKAKTYAERSGYISLADDSGLEVDFLQGGPGVNSARYAGDNANDSDRVKKLLDVLKDVPPSRRSARFRCVVCLYDPRSKEKIFSEGICPGVIIDQPRGNNGFGYDPIFVPNGFKLTMAELPAAEKNKISHRGRAFLALKEKIGLLLS